MIVCGTGHRPDKLGGYTVVARERLELFAVGVLAAHMTECNLTYVVSGMAQGWDQALAVAAITLGLPWTAAIPFYGQETTWPEEAQAHYWDLMAHADEIAVVCEGEYAGWKMNRRNEWMVRQSQWCLALYNGDPAGGTANCVRFAEKELMRNRVINVWEDWLVYQKG